MPAAAHTASVNYVQIMHNLTVAVDPAGGGTTTLAAGVHSYAEAAWLMSRRSCSRLPSSTTGAVTAPEAALPGNHGAAKTVTAHFAMPPTCYALT